MPRSRSLHIPYICARCLRPASNTASTVTRSAPAAPPSRSTRAYSASPTLPPAPPSSGRTQLTHRRLLLLHGPDTTHFLHGITTATVRHGQTTGFYSAFLTAQGRVLHDVFIYPASHSSTYTSRLPSNAKYDPSDPAYFIEVDATQTTQLLKHLKRYKLRAKVDIRVVDEGEWDVHAYWDGEERWTAHSQAPTPSPASNSDAASPPNRISATDSRAPGLGRRLILPGANTTLPPHLETLASTPLTSYHIRRTLRGVPEGQSSGEIPSGTSLPHELNFDLMSGIDFKKGCYVGQELTIRTQHTGVVRKRVLPVMLYGVGEGMPRTLEYAGQALTSGEGSVSGVSSGTNILPLDTNPTSKARPRPAGKILSNIGRIGLGLCRIEKMTDVVLTAEGSGWSADEEFYLPAREEDRSEGKEHDKSEGGVRVKAFVPDWIRNQIKVREPQRRID